MINNWKVIFRTIHVLMLPAAGTLWCCRDGAQAATLLSEDYEVAPGNLGTGTQSNTELTSKGWLVVCASSPCNADIVTTRAHGGTRSLRLTYDTTQPVFDEIRDVSLFHTFSPITEMYERFWIYYEVIDNAKPWMFVGESHLATDGTLYPIGASSKHHFYNNGHPTNPILGYHYNTGADSTLTMGDQHNNYEELCPDATGAIGSNGGWGLACNYIDNMNPTNITMPLNQWVCMEVHLTMNTPGVQDGVIDIWQDGVQLTHFVGTMFRPAGDAVTDLFDTLNVYRQGALNLYRYEDDDVIATTEAEAHCPGVFPADPTTPAAPRGLRVI